ncbi:hypothetical protein GCM10009565_34720 [Amycolatopsis albidoflavus]
MRLVFSRLSLGIGAVDSKRWSRQSGESVDGSETGRVRRLGSGADHGHQAGRHDQADYRSVEHCARDAADEAAAEEVSG